VDTKQRIDNVDEVTLLLDPQGQAAIPPLRRALLQVDLEDGCTIEIVLDAIQVCDILNDADDIGIANWTPANAADAPES
jgi:hypothetical protein